MIRRFLVSEPLQAIKLAVATGLLVAAVLAIGGFVPDDRELSVLLSLPLVALLLSVTVALETLRLAYGWLATGVGPVERASRRPGYALVRALEAGVAAVGVGSIVVTFVTLPDGDLPPPAAIGVLFVVAAAGVAVVAASFVRGLVELSAHRRRSGIENSR